MSEPVLVTIRGLLPDLGGVAVFLGNDDKIFVIHMEKQIAAVIWMFLRNHPKERPLTHDLIVKIFDGLGVTIERVVITGLIESTFFANLVLQYENEPEKDKLEFDSRPSDCLALASATKSPIYVEKTLFEKVEDMSEILKRSFEEPEKLLETGPDLDDE